MSEVVEVLRWLTAPFGLAGIAFVFWSIYEATGGKAGGRK